MVLLYVVVAGHRRGCACVTGIIDQMVQRYENASTGLTKIVAVIPKSDKDGELYCMATVCMPNSNVGPQEAKLDSTAEPWLPPGFRFHPTDEELVSYYLTRKVVDSNFAVHAIAEVDLNKCEPWDLPGVHHLGLFVRHSGRMFRFHGCPWAGRSSASLLSSMKFAP